MSEKRLPLIVFEREIPPHADVVFLASVKGLEDLTTQQKSEYQRAKFVLSHLNISHPEELSSENDDKGYSILEAPSGPLVFFIRIPLFEKEVDTALFNVLSVIFREERERLSHKTLWMPFLGVEGPLSYNESYSTIIQALEADGFLFDGGVDQIQISVPQELPEEEFQAYQNQLEERGLLMRAVSQEKWESQKVPTESPKLWVLSNPFEGKDSLDISLTKKREIQWPVPFRCRKGDFALMWANDGMGFLYFLEVLSILPANEPHPTALLKIEYRFKERVTLEHLRQEEVLSAWDLLERGMVDTHKYQDRDLLSQPLIWERLKKLLKERDPEFKDPLEKIRSDSPAILKMEKNWQSDQRSPKDHLGHKPIVDGLATFIKSKNTPFPMVVCIDAPWGKGKSSIMRQLQFKLQKGDLEEVEEREQSSNLLKPAAFNWRRTLEVMELRERGNYEPESSREAEEASSFKEWFLDLWALIRGQPFKKKSDPLTGKNKNGGPSTRQEGASREFETIHFNAWRHGSGLQLTASLVNFVMHTVANRMGAKNRETFWLYLNMKRINFDKLRRDLASKVLGKGLAGMVFLLLLTALGLGTDIHNGAALFGGASGLIFALFKAFEEVRTFDFTPYIQAPDYGSIMGPQSAIEKDFSETLNFLESKGKSLAIFIDDLDRCSPDRVVEVVETINVFFGQDERRAKNCIFVVGMHLQLVATNLELAYEKLVRKVKKTPYLAEELPFGQRFLEKIIQFVVRIPEPEERDIEKYLQHITKSGQKPQPLEKEMRKEVLDELRQKENFFEKREEHLAELEKRFQSHGREKAEARQEAESFYQEVSTEKIAKELDDKSEEVLAVFKLIREALRKNPRQYNRFLNALRFEHYLDAGNRDKPVAFEELLGMAKWTAFSLEWPTQANELWDKRGDFIKTFAGAKGASSNGDAMGSFKEMARIGKNSHNNGYWKELFDDERFQRLLEISHSSHGKEEGPGEGSPPS